MCGYNMTADDRLNGIRLACKLASRVLDFLEPCITQGATTIKLDDIAQKYMEEELDCYPAPLTVGFPKSICVSINDEACHGIPSQKHIKNGDIVKVDVSLLHKGYFGDNCRTYIVGNILDKRSAALRYLSDTAYNALFEGASAIKPGVNSREIGKRIESYVRSKGLTVIREFCGHGIGEELHQDYQIPHYFETRHEGIILQEGMTFTIEPIITSGNGSVKLMSDGWTYKTKDRAPCAQWEHTFLVTREGYEVLTLS